MAPKTRITLKDVAQRCGYSVNTVSRALRGDEHLPQDTKERIQNAAMEVGYIKNTLASSLRSGRSHVIAIIIEELQNQHYSALLNLLSLYLARQGYRVMILTNRRDTVEKASSASALPLAVSYAISHGVDGVFFFPERTDQAAAIALRANHIPLVLIDREIEGMDLSIVRVDDYDGGRLAAKLLLERNHRDILYLCGPEGNGSQPLREQGFLDTLKERGINRSSIRRISHEDFLRAIEEDTLESLILPIDYTAVFSFNDQLAYYLMGCLQGNGYQIPGDISVLGFDNIRASFPYMPALSTIGIAHQNDLALNAVSLMCERIENPDQEPEKIILPVRYVEGGTLSVCGEGRNPHHL